MKNRNNRKDPKEYMRLAVEVMKKSIPERNKKNPSPYVGAVLVFPDGDIETAYRGEMREGDHAEYTLLDRKNRQRELTGCWLFVTLEPCAPGARNAPKLSCSERIVNARISDVWFGIEDKNPTIDHAGIDYLISNGVKVHQFAPEFHKKIEEVNKEFMRWAKMKNESARIKNAKLKSELNRTIQSDNLESLSDVALQKFISESNKNFSIKSKKLLRELKDMELLEYDSVKGKYLPTGNAILLFGKTPRNKFPQAAVKAKVHYGDGRIGTETFCDALVLVPDKTEEWLKKVLPASIDRRKFKAQQIPSFPIEVIREAIINAIAHRDYTIDGAKVQLEIFPERIVIKSPGKPPLPITIEAMKNFTATSYSRNKKITFIFNEMGYMEETALGMDTFKSMRKDYNLPLPIIEYDGMNVVITFLRTDKAIKDVRISGLKNLNNEELKGYEFIKIKGKIRRTEYEEEFQYDKKKAERHLGKFVKNHLISRKGSGPSTYYEFIAT